jgi:hypothetical protein
MGERKAMTYLKVHRKVDIKIRPPMTHASTIIFTNDAAASS